MADKISLKVPKNVVDPFGVSTRHGKPALLYASKRRGHNKLSYATSTDGMSFSEEFAAPIIMTRAGQTEDINQTNDFYFSQVLDESFLTYSRKGQLRIARTIDQSEWDLATWQSLRTNLPKAQSGIIVPEYKWQNHYVLIYSTSTINVAVSDNLRRWQSPHSPVLSPRRGYFDNTSLKLISANAINEGILILYQSTNKRGSKQIIHVGCALLSKENPAKVLWRSSNPIWEKTVSKSDSLEIKGAIYQDKRILIYISSKKGKFFSVALPHPYGVGISRPQPGLELKRYSNNPILGPEGGQDWEQVGTFNPAVLHDGDTVHILYRALAPSGLSYIGYAQSSNGYDIDYRSPEPCYWPRAEFEGANNPSFSKWSESYGSGGGWGGCEDPKLTKIGDTIYLTYVAHNGWSPPRVAMSSISKRDFLNHNWNKWEQPRLISKPGEVNKSAVILPEKINNKYLVFHRVFPNILIHYTADLNRLGRQEWLAEHDSIKIRPHQWDSRKISVGSTPLRIKEGWLVIYHAVDDRDDSKYKIGAMILDYNNPAKVLYRTDSPILEPRQAYENEWKFGIAYPSGAAILNDTLFVYYGGGDRHVCVATANLNEFIDNMKKHQAPKLHREKQLV